jgi:hypothetical protein
LLDYPARRTVKMLRRLIATVALSLLMIPLAAGKPGNGKGKGQDKNKGVEVFAPEDQRVLNDYHASGRQGGLPPGLAKRDGSLPPGLEKQLQRNGRLPPGLEKKMAPYPAEIHGRMSPLAPGLARGYISGRAVIYNPRTRVILDVYVPGQ